MITEDYVSFEIAKLLKEKGFECEKKSITAMYNEVGEFLSLSTAADEYYDYSYFDEYDYVAPTLQTAMKWLREVYKIFIEISVSIDLNGNYHYSYSILNRECKYVRKGYTDFNWNYEQACEAAIKYYLEKLI